MRASIACRLTTAAVLIVAGGVIGPAAQATSKVATDRIAGLDRYETAAMLAATADGTQCSGCPGFASPVVASGDAYADALGAANLEMTPVLLTGRDSLPAPTRAYLENYAASGDNLRVDIAGGTASISSAVVREIKSLGLMANRFAGADRYDTAEQLLIASQGFGAKIILLASGERFPDALAAGPVIGELRLLGYGLLLTPNDHLPPAVRNYLQNDPEASVIIVGGESVVSTQVQSELGIQYRDRIAGADRYQTAALLADHLAQRRQLSGQSAITRVFLASGQTFPDALASADLAARTQGAILLAGPAELPSATHDWLHAHRVDVAKVTAVGGRASVSDHQLEQAAAAAMN